MKVLKFLFITLLALAILLFLGYRYFLGSIQPQVAPNDETNINFSATRLTNRPIIYPTMHPKLVEEATAYGYTNINGPSLTKVPNWVNNKLGNYYLYFAHHKGAFIRLTYADTLTGEGAKEPLIPSSRGEMGIKVNQLRDPAIFEENGQLYLLYTGGGEQAIGIAKLSNMGL